MPAILLPGYAGSSSSIGNGCMLIFPYGQLLAHCPQPMHQSSMMTSSELRRRMEPTGQPTMHSGSRHCRQEVATRYLIESQSFADQAADAIMSVGAGPHALVAAGAAIQVENQQALRFHQALVEKTIDGDIGDLGHSLTGSALCAQPPLVRACGGYRGSDPASAGNLRPLMRTTST